MNTRQGETVKQSTVAGIKSPMIRTSPPLTGVAAVLALSATQGILLAAGPAPVDLGSAAHFTVLAATTITTTGGGSINGDVGVYPSGGSSIHLTQGQVNGTIYAKDGTGPPGAVIAPTLLLAAMNDLTTAFNEARDRVPTPVGPFLNPGDGNLAGMTLAPGLYKFTGQALISTDVTLAGGADDVWIFQVASNLELANGIQIILAGGAQARNIYWQVGSSAVIGTTAVFKGTILALQAVTMNTGSTMDGRALASNAAVTYNGTGGSLPTPETPRFTNISRTAEGAVTVALDTTPYFQLTLQTSTSLDATSWTTITTATPASSPWTFTQPAAEATGPKRFYRAFLAPF